MWRLLCISYFGAFACGAASEAYGPHITSAARTASKLVKVPASLTPPGVHSFCEQCRGLLLALEKVAVQDLALLLMCI